MTHRTSEAPRRPIRGLVTFWSLLSQLANSKRLTWTAPTIVIVIVITVTVDVAVTVVVIIVTVTVDLA